MHVQAPSELQEALICRLAPPLPTGDALHSTVINSTNEYSGILMACCKSLRGQLIGENKHFGDAGAKPGSDSGPVLVPSTTGELTY